MKKVFLVLLISILIINISSVYAKTGTDLSAEPVSGEPTSINSLENHWAYQYVMNGTLSGWLDLSLLFLESNIDKEIPRADFVVLLEKSIGLTPDSNTAKFLEGSSSQKSEIPFSDVSDSSITTEGFLKNALNFGLIFPSDYLDNKFYPDFPLSRREAVLIMTRAVGRQYPAMQYNQNSSLFGDWSSVPEWIKGYFSELVNLNILLGYPDGNVKYDNNLTYGEAIALIDRAYKENHQGIDSDIKVYAANIYNGETLKQQQAELIAPAQIINNVIFVPVRTIFSSGSKLYGSNEPNYVWIPSEQKLRFDYGVEFEFQAGNDYIGFYNTFLPDKGMFNDMADEARLLNGEIMVPVIDNGATARLRYTGENNWNADTKELIINIHYPDHPYS